MHNIPLQTRPIKWSYATRSVKDLPLYENRITERLAADDAPPARNDVVLAEIIEIGRHRRLELQSARRTQLYTGDLVGVVFGQRYATRQFEGVVPDYFAPCHLLSIGGVCGEVMGMPEGFGPPTVIRPIAYIRDESGSRRLNLGDHGLPSTATPKVDASVTLVIGSSMDSGKTTTMASLVHGLSRAGRRVCAAKITGTASAKDLLHFEDAGAYSVLDFTAAGHASTAGCTEAELITILDSTLGHFGAMHPQHILLEVADGVVQRETAMLLDVLSRRRLVDTTLYACHDGLGMQVAIDRMREIGLPVAAVSGCVAMTSLAAREAQALVDVPIVSAGSLRDPRIATQLTMIPVRCHREPARVSTTTPMC